MKFLATSTVVLLLCFAATSADYIATGSVGTGTATAKRLNDGTMLVSANGKGAWAIWITPDVATHTSTTTKTTYSSRNWPRPRRMALASAQSSYSRMSQVSYPAQSRTNNLPAGSKYCGGSNTLYCDEGATCLYGGNGVWELATLETRHRIHRGGSRHGDDRSSSSHTGISQGVFPAQSRRPQRPQGRYRHIELQSDGKGFASVKESKEGAISMLARGNGHGSAQATWNSQNRARGSRIALTSSQNSYSRMSQVSYPAQSGTNLPAGSNYCGESNTYYCEVEAKCIYGENGVWECQYETRITIHGGDSQQDDDRSSSPHTEINECEEDDPCAEDEICFNTWGSYECDLPVPCPEGYARPSTSAIAEQDCIREATTNRQLPETITFMKIAVEARNYTDSRRTLGSVKFPNTNTGYKHHFNASVLEGADNFRYRIRRNNKMDIKIYKGKALEPNVNLPFAILVTDRMVPKHRPHYRPSGYGGGYGYGYGGGSYNRPGTGQVTTKHKIVMEIVPMVHGTAEDS